MWQDIVISISIILLSYALIPQVIQGFKKRKCDINIQTSAITAAGLYILAVCFWTLNLYFSFAMDLVTGTL